MPGSREMVSESTVVFHRGVVRTMAERAPSASALVVRDGKVVASGSDADMRRVAGADAREVNLRGASVMPGIIDTHPHVIHFGIANATHVDIGDATSHDEIVNRIRKRAATTPEGEWIFTTPVGEPHYFIRRSWRDLKEGTLPDRHALDRATVKHPVMLQAWAPSIPNACALNTLALKQMAFSRETPERVSNVWIDKDPSGEPTGILRGSVTNYYTGDAWWDEQLRKLPRPTPVQVLDGLRAAVREYSALGVTTGYEGHVMDEHLIGAYRAIRDEGALTLRVLTTIEAEHYVWATDKKLTFDEYRANCELARSMTDLSDDLVRVNGLTIESGGPCNPGFLRMRDPFKGPYGELTRGRVFVEKEKIEYAIDFCARTGVRLNVIAERTGEHDEFLDMCEAVACAYPDVKGRHWILQHVFFLEEQQARRYAALGFDATASMSFVWGKGDLLTERVGGHLMKDFMPLRRMVDAGIRVSLGSDWGPKNPFEHLELAMTHRYAGSGRSNLGPAQRVEREEAVAMFTREAARLLQWEGIGTLQNGYLADLIVVDRDPLACATEELSKTRVLLTMLGGRTVHDAGAL